MLVAIGVTVLAVPRHEQYSPETLSLAAAEPCRSQTRPWELRPCLLLQPPPPQLQPFLRRPYRPPRPPHPPRPRRALLDCSEASPFCAITPTAYTYTRLTASNVHVTTPATPALDHAPQPTPRSSRLLLPRPFPSPPSALRSLSDDKRPPSTTPPPSPQTRRPHRRAHHHSPP